MVIAWSRYRYTPSGVYIYYMVIVRLIPLSLAPVRSRSGNGGRNDEIAEVLYDSFVGYFCIIMVCLRSYKLRYMPILWFYLLSCYKI